LPDESDNSSESAARFPQKWRALGLARPLLYPEVMTATALLEERPANETGLPGPSRDADDAMARYARGDERDFAAVHAFVAPRLASYLRRRLRDQARVPDLVQQTFLHMHRARRTFRSGAAVLPWAFAIARRQLVDAVRADERERALDGYDAFDDDASDVTVFPGGDELLAAKEAARRVELAFAGLTPPQRAAFVLVKADGLSLARAANVLGTTVTGVKLRTHRAYAALRLALLP
jgi:RNA polymerase sigma-70 factor (ECF subfamily)